MMPAGAQRFRPVMLIFTFMGLLSFACVAGQAAAQPPPDDVCSGATQLPQGVTTGDLTPYTNDYDPGPSGCTGSAAPGKDQVFYVDLLCQQGVSLTYTPNGFDGSIYVVTDCSDIANTCIGGADDAGVDGVEYVDAYPGVAMRVYIIVDAHDPNAGGPFTLEMSLVHYDPPLGACCFPDGHCEFLMSIACQNMGGDFHPCILCTPDPCGSTPAEHRSWGRIKSIYR